MRIPLIIPRSLSGPGPLFNFNCGFILLLCMYIPIAMNSTAHTTYDVIIKRIKLSYILLL